jgi:hypothetical protein
MSQIFNLAKSCPISNVFLKPQRTILRHYRFNVLPLRLAKYRTLQPRHSRSSLSCSALLSPETAFNVATLVVMPFYGLIIAAPQKPLTRKLMTSKIPLYCAAAFYLALLFLWNPLGNFWEIIKAAITLNSNSALKLPDMTVFATAFNSAEATTLAWLHLVTLDLFQAR